MATVFSGLVMNFGAPLILNKKRYLMKENLKKAV